jgi:hypothetical protein
MNYSNVINTIRLTIQQQQQGPKVEKRFEKRTNKNKNNKMCQLWFDTKN